MQHRGSIQCPEELSFCLKAQVTVNCTSTLLSVLVSIQLLCRLTQVSMTISRQEAARQSVSTQIILMQ